MTPEPGGLVVDLDTTVTDADLFTERDRRLASGADLSVVDVRALVRGEFPS